MKCLHDVITSHTALVLKQTDWAFVLCSLKRKPGSLFYCVKKKPCLWEVRKPDSENMAEEKNPGKQKDATETPSSEKTKQDGSSRAEKQADKAQRVVTNLTWTHSLPSTQTVMVSPLSRTEGPRSRPPPPQGSDWDVNVQRLAGLEKEAQRLRRLLGLEIKKTTQGTMTTADGGPATADSREVGCQTDDAEVSRVYCDQKWKCFIQGHLNPPTFTDYKWRSNSKTLSDPFVVPLPPYQSSTSSSSPDRASGLEEVLAQGQGAVCGPKEQPEQDRPSKDKMESQSRVRAGDNEAFEDIRCVFFQIRTSVYRESLQITHKFLFWIFADLNAVWTWGTVNHDSVPQSDRHRRVCSASATT